MQEINKVKDNAIDNLPQGERRTFDSIDKALNWADHYRKNKVYRQENRDRGLDRHPISKAMPEDRRQYLIYGLSMLRKSQYIRPNEYEMHVALLKLRVLGYPAQLIAKHIGTTLEKLQIVEKQALARVKDAILLKKRTGVPVIGG